MHHPEIRKLRHREMSAAEPVNHNLPRRVNRPDRRDHPPDEGRMIRAGQPVLSDARRFIEQIKAQKLAWDARITPGKQLPLEYKRVLGDFVHPEIMLFQVIVINAVPRRPVQVQAHLEAAAPAGVQVGVNDFQDFFIRVEIVKLFRPSPVVRREPDKVKAGRREKVQRLLVRRLRRPPVVRNIHPQKVKAIICHERLFTSCAGIPCLLSGRVHCGDGNDCVSQTASRRRKRRCLVPIGPQESQDYENKISPFPQRRLVGCMDLCYNRRCVSGKPRNSTNGNGRENQ